MDQQALFARQGALHRPLQQPRGERGLALVAHVFLAAKRTAVGDQFDGDLIGRHVEDRSDLIAVVPHALAAGIHVQATVGGWNRQRAFRLEERVLNALRVEHLVHDVMADSERGIHVAALIRAGRQDVVLRTEHGDFRVGDRRHRIGDRSLHVVLNANEFRGLTRLQLGVGNDDGKHVAGIRRALPFTNEDRPVLIDDADVLSAGNVGRGVHRDDARCR